MSLTAIASTPVHFVNQPNALQACLHHLQTQTTLSFDIEFDNNSYGYGVTLCVIQVATPTACFVIDGLAGLDLAPLFTLFQHQNIQKLVHSPGEDLRLLHSLGCFPKNVYDTEVPARLLNYEHTSLTVLLREKLAVDLNKKQQRSNWLRRPLTDAQIQYAADDVIWLHPLKTVLETEAAAGALLPFVEEEQAFLSTTLYPAAPKTGFLKPSDLHHLSPREQYITNELLRFRDGLARQINRPPYQVMNEDLVRSLASGVCRPENIVHEAGVHPRFKTGRFAGQLARLLQEARKEAAAQNLPAEKERPKRTPASEAAGRRAAADRETIFAPIQEALVQRFGLHAARFMLSNRLVGNLVQGVVSLQQLPRYRQALFAEMAAAAGVELSRYTSAAGKD